MKAENSLIAKSRSPHRDCRLARALTVASIFVLLMLGRASAHGVVGNRVFLSPIVGNDAFPDNALDLSARRSGYVFSLLPRSGTGQIGRQ
jgi:hypothetical protein